MALSQDQFDLLGSAERGEIDVLRALIDGGTKLDGQCDKGHTALIYAVAWERIECIHLLLDAGADMSLQNQLKETALDTARKFGMDNIVSILLAEEKDRRFKKWVGLGKPLEQDLPIAPPAQVVRRRPG